jgi:hypothetical protein
MGELEAHVYNTLHQELSGIISTAYYARSYPGGRFIIIMEDLEERGIKPYWMGDMCSLNHARAGAVSLAKIHSKFWNSNRFEHDLSWIRPQSRRFGELWMRKLSQDSRKKFLATDMGKNLPLYIHNLIRQWDENCTTYIIIGKPSRKLYYTVTPILAILWSIRMVLQDITIGSAFSADMAIGIYLISL